jgi:flagellar protein FlgJ
MDLGGISSYTDYLTKQSTASAKLNDTLTNTDYSNADEDKLLSVCKEFEAYFLEQVFKEMQKTVDCLKEEGSDPNEHLVDYFKENVIQDLTKTSTEKQGLGIAQMLYEQMKRNYNMT